MFKVYLIDQFDDPEHHVQDYVAGEFRTLEEALSLASTDARLGHMDHWYRCDPDRNPVMVEVISDDSETGYSQEPVPHAVLECTHGIMKGTRTYTAIIAEVPDEAT